MEFEIIFMFCLYFTLVSAEFQFLGNLDNLTFFPLNLLQYI